MTLAEAYANNCGLKLPESAPDFPSNFFFTPKEYIVVHSGAGEKSRIYDHWNITFDILAPKLGNIKVVQIGGKDDPAVSGTIDLRGQTSYRQSAWIVENALCAAVSDSVWAHVAGHKNVPLVALYSVNPASCARPYYYNKDKTVLLESHRNGMKPTYDLPEKIKTINLIKPEEIARAILKNIDLDSSVEIETIKVGADVNSAQVDFIPDFPIPADALNGKPLVCRLDLCYNVQALAQCLTFYQAAIVTNKSIPRKILEKYKNKIHFIQIKLEQGYSKQFIDDVHKLGINYQLVSEAKDRELSDVRLDLFDYRQVFTKKVFDNSGVMEYDKVMTPRIFLSQNHFFPSVYHWRQGVTFDGKAFQIGDALNDKEFWDSGESYWIFRDKPEVLHFA